MKADQRETLILYHTDLRGQWPQIEAAALARRLPYARRTRMRPGSAERASLAGVALALRALSHLLGRRVEVEELRFPRGARPRLATADAAPGFSISHAGPWVGCAALRGAQVGLDIEMGTAPRIADWVLREALLKADGAGLRALAEVRALPVARGGVRWRGVHWRVRRLRCFAGACACVTTSRAPRALAARALPLEELFTS